MTHTAAKLHDIERRLSAACLPALVGHDVGKGTIADRSLLPTAARITIKPNRNTAARLWCVAGAHRWVVSQRAEDKVEGVVQLPRVVAKQVMHACRQGFEAKAETLEEDHMVASNIVDRTKVNIEAKQRAEDDIRRDVELAKLGEENAMVERVSMLGTQNKISTGLSKLVTLLVWAGFRHTAS